MNRQRLLSVIARRPWLLSAIGVGCLALLIWSVVAQVSRASAERERAAFWELHTVQVQLQAQMLLVAVEAAESGQRGFLLSGDRRYLTGYEEGVRNARTRFDQLQRLTQDNPPQQQRVHALDQVLAERLRRMERVLKLAASGRHAGAIQMLRDEHNREVMVDLRERLDEIWQSESILLHARQEQSRLAVEEERRTAALGIWLGLVMLFGVAVTTAAAINATELARRQSSAAEVARQVQSLLQQRVDEALAEQRRTEAALRQAQKMEAIGQLAGGIAHDFNNMLTIILGSLEMAQRRYASGQTDVRRYLANAEEGARRAAVLTQRVLAFSRQQPLEPKVVDCNALIGAMSELLHRSIGAQVQMRTVLAADLWPIRIDANQFENVVLNLAVNARDAMPDGGVLTISTRNESLTQPQITAGETVAAGDYVCIEVADTGVGMSPEVAARAFDPFFTTKRVGKGTGLGLSQTFGFVRQSGGHIRIETEQGKGTTIRMLLPRSEADATQADTGTGLAPPQGGGHETIIVVEDDEKVRMISVDALRDLGYTVQHARSGAQALDLLALNADIALLFTDLAMPDMNGQELAAEAQRRHPDLKVLFTSGYGRGTIMHDTVRSGVVSYLAKPFTIEQLAQTVRQMLDA